MTRLRFLALSLLLAPLAPAAAPAQEGRTVGSYTFGGGELRVDTDGRRVALFAADRDGSRVLVYVDPSSVARWLDEAGAIVKSRSPRGEEETSPLTHRDDSMKGSVVLSRSASGGREPARLYLTVVGDSDHIAMIPLTPMDARIVIAALDRAAAESRPGP